MFHYIPPLGSVRIQCYLKFALWEEVLLDSHLKTLTLFNDEIFETKILFVQEYEKLLTQPTPHNRVNYGCLQTFLVMKAYNCLRGAHCKKKQPFYSIIWNTSIAQCAGWAVDSSIYNPEPYMILIIYYSSLLYMALWYGRDARPAPRKNRPPRPAPPRPAPRKYGPPVHPCDTEPIFEGNLTT